MSIVQNNRFLQLHLLTSYGPANLNRDDQGRPKTAIFGNSQRLRISSQSLKRAWRTSELFTSALDGHTGKRTKRLGREAYDQLLTLGVEAKSAFEWSRAIGLAFGAMEKEEAPKKSTAKAKGKTTDAESEVAAPEAGNDAKDPLKALLNTTMVFVSQQERDAVDALVKLLAEQRRAPKPEELKFLSKDTTAADIALFGRMLADDAGHNVDGSAQIAHALTVHGADVEDDYFSAVDDLNPAEATGSGHIGEQGFGAGVFYLYACVDRQMLLDNLGGNQALAARTLRALVECAATIAPTGKQNSFASRAYASYVLAELGAGQPRALSMAFLRPLSEEYLGSDADLMGEAIKRLQQSRERLEAVYGKTSEPLSCNAHQGEGTLAAVLDFASGHWE